MKLVCTPLSIVAPAIVLLATAVRETSAATLVVSNSTDSSAGSLRATVTSAASGDIITFAAGLAGQKIVLTSGEILLNKNLTIDGSALANRIQINGNHASRVFNVQSNSTVFLNQLTITNAFIPDDVGGGIYNEGLLTVSNCTFARNWSGSAGGAIHSEGGALAVRNSTFFANTSADEGGAISEHGSLRIVNSTFTANTANAGGGLRIITVGDGDPTSVVSDSSI
ncbi:MAG: hypothetical protein C5B50_15640 [Verrucomicrobia bacterium]|nr:MAG: hypothetical protein C5B50_15640 [Verrucomicrobiota bacterium]